MENILISRRSRNERLKFHRALFYKKIRQYIKGGCKGDLELREAPIEYLPEELKHVGGSLYLTNSQLKKLPDGLTKVDEDLVLRNTDIESLPDNLTYIGGTLNVAKTKIKKLSPNLKQIKDDLILSNTDISELPANLQWGKSLYCENTKFVTFPYKRTINGSVSISGTKIKTIPNNLSINGCFYMRKTLIEEIPYNLHIIDTLFCDDSKLLYKYGLDGIKNEIINRGGSVRLVIKLIDIMN